VSKLRELKQQILHEGTDLQIDEADWTRIRELLPADGKPSADDVHALVEMRAEARSVCPAFDAYFFPAFKAHLLADGSISTLEQFQLLRMLYGGGGVDAAERRFLQELRGELKSVTPEFESLYQLAMQS
jgi:hypothetical protein